MVESFSLEASFDFHVRGGFLLEILHVLAGEDKVDRRSNS
jgi:hypothetical protein